MRIDIARFINFNCFEDREFRFAPRFNLIIGDNAKGKTSVLDGLSVGLGALFLGFPPPAATRSIHRDEVRLAFYLHGTAATAEHRFPVEVRCEGVVGDVPGTWSRELTSIDGRTTRQNAGWMRKVSNQLRTRVQDGEPVPLPVVSYYGTGRLGVQMRQREVETLAPLSRFAGYLDCLNPASDEKRLLEWFKTKELMALQQRISIGELEACRRAILACLPEARDVRFDVARDELVVRLLDQEMPFSYLSDGLRNMVAMVADIAVRCATLNPALEGNAAKETVGVVLIDEIDLHLHPKWQRRVVLDLMTAFPKVQFVATTHSPFVIQSLPSVKGVRLINLDNPEAEDFANKSVEDISEQVQGVALPQRSQRWLDMFHKAEEYYRLLQEIPNAPEAEKQQLSKRLDELTLPFSDDPAYQAFLQFQKAASGLNGEA